MERRLAKNPPECSFENKQSEPLPTLEEAKQSFEDDKSKTSTPEEREEKKKAKLNKNQLPITQKDSANKDFEKRPLSDDSSPNSNQISRKKNQYR